MKNSGPEQVGLGYRAVSVVGGDRERAPQMVPYEVSIGLILIVRLVNAFGSGKAIARMFPNPTQNGLEGTTAWGMSASRCKAHVSLWVIKRAALSDQGPGHKDPGSASKSTDEPHAGKLARVVLAGDPEAEAESVVGYNVEYAWDAILNSSLLAEANVPGSRGLILTETRGESLPSSKYSILGKRYSGNPP
ncbi:hypothetical protein CQW23_27015 [Capsicum baccatum]|uniref:Uncharacterized protein n=1 Tax=Capsicum baccatum TaxID=33114 RepID=A0A2G2VQF5_CAPBA|nr:hypothetical protein CQW23_27015 [Capsicum baccatum]